MPRSIFLGRPVPAPGEPLWLDEDREWAHALLQVEADSCPECRQPWGKATDPSHEFKWHAEVLRCHACATGQRVMEQYQSKGGDIRGVHVHVQHKQ